MRLHTNLANREIYQALARAVAKGKIAPDVSLMKLDAHGSRSHVRSFDFALGTWEKDTLPKGYRDQNGRKLTVRRYSNSGNSGAANEYGGRNGSVWAATWHEWGWFMIEIFDADPSAMFGSLKGYGYKNLADFHDKTHGAFDEVNAV
jgi:hypothetical protein